MPNVTDLVSQGHPMEANETAEVVQQILPQSSHLETTPSPEGKVPVEQVGLEALALLRLTATSE